MQGEVNHAATKLVIRHTVAWLGWIAATAADPLVSRPQANNLVDVSPMAPSCGAVRDQ